MFGPECRKVLINRVKFHINHQFSEKSLALSVVVVVVFQHFFIFFQFFLFHFTHITFFFIWNSLKKCGFNMASMVILGVKCVSNLHTPAHKVLFLYRQLTLLVFVFHLLRLFRCFFFVCVAFSFYEFLLHSSFSVFT